MTSPAVEVRTFAVTIPAGTPQSAPVTQQITFPPREVTGITWKVPPGPSGLMGWKLTMSNGQQVLPAGSGYIVADDQSDTWPLTNLPDSGAWEVTGYNTGAFPHTVYLTFLLDVITGAAQSPALISTAAISAPAPSTIPGITVPGAVTIPAVTAPQPVTVTTVTTPPPVTIPAVTTPPPVTVPPVTTGP